MQRSIISLAAVACLVAVLGGGSPARAQFFATFVSGNGSDANDCLTPATACRQFEGATGVLSKTSADGVIHVLAGDYLPFTIIKALDIIADDATASVTLNGAPPPPGITGNSAIAVNVAAGDVVRLRGFTLFNSQNGIAIGGSGGIVHLEECTFVGGLGLNGIAYAPSATSELYVSDSRVSRQTDTAAKGILIKPSGSASARVVLDNVNIENNVVGVTVDGRGTTGTNSVTVRDTTVTGSATFGLFAIDSGNGVTNVSVEGSSITNNSQQGIIANGANVTVRVRSSVITGNRVGLAISNSAKIISHGDNVNAGNTAGQGAFTQTLAPQ